MDERKRKRLEEMGGYDTSVAEFLQLTPESEAWIEIKLALTRLAIRLRRQRGITQAQLAKILEVKQPNVAKLEGGSPSVGFDMLMRTVLALGANPAMIAAEIGAVEITYTGAPSRWPDVNELGRVQTADFTKRGSALDVAARAFKSVAKTLPRGFCGSRNMNCTQ